jgi:Dolichyl-phosphate-mannose-protein mannosyltransferase
LILARETFLNPDEALHYLLSDQSSLAMAYKASLTTAHPPLLVLVLHYWRLLGRSELALRTLALLTGTAFCWMMYLWLRRVADRATALAGLTLFLFAPSLITLSAEVRQYSLLLLFAASSLYFLERALEENSSRMMLLALCALYLALLSHYSSLIFALAISVYALVRFFAARELSPVLGTWIVGQLGAVTLCAFLIFTHVLRVRRFGLPQGIADTWLRSSIFHSGEDHFLTFILGRTTRLFRYFFSHGTIGVAALLLFVFAIVLLLHDKRTPESLQKPASRQIAILLALPFLITLGTAIAGIYPYGGTRHDSLLIMFAIPGVSIGLVRLKVRWPWMKPVALAAGLAICNVFSYPPPPYIPRKNQNRKFMREAIRFVRQSVPSGSTVYVDHPGGLLLSYYLCGNSVVPFESQSQAFLTSRCGDYEAVTPARRLWSFDPDTFPGTVQEMRRRHELHPEAQVWIFQSGWIDWHEEVWIAQLRDYGCYDPQQFGPNIIVCKMILDAKRPESN